MLFRSGEKTLRGIAEYLKRRNLKVGTFYTSNVEQYLFESDAWQRFYRNLAELPLEPDAMIVRTYFTSSVEGMRELLQPARELLEAVTRGEVKTYDDVIARSRVPRT